MMSNMMNPLSPTKSSQILSGLPQPVLVVNDKGQINYANFASEEFFSLGQTLLQTKKLDEIVPFGSPLIGLVDKVIKSGNTINEYEIDLGTPRTGKKQMVDVQVAPVPGDENEVMLIIQKKSIASKIDRQLTHRGAARSVSGMAAMLAHEIKNPLSGIKGAAQLLETELGEHDRALTHLICSETDRIAGLVDQFEVFTDQPLDQTDDVNIHTVLNHVAQIARNGFGQHVKIQENYDPSLPALRGNKDQLIQVFLNLVKNAAEAVDKTNGKIILQTSFRPGVRLALPGRGTRISLPLEFCVIDNGAGIDEDLRNIIFEPFVTNKSNGTGLGLALVAKIIDDHGGVIECESEPGQTIFRVLMPIGEKLSKPKAVQDNESADT